MIRHFCAYGFLKNQRYFEPFLVLILLGRGLDFLAIGSLVAVRELTVNLVEVPSGVIADLFGKRGSLMVCFVAYVAAFLTFSLVGASPAGLSLAMALTGLGDAFRSGSHKALIFTWLRLQGRADERTEVYGLTRSWSKLGSALSSLIAAAVVLATGTLEWLFPLSALPPLLSILNLLAYPRELEGAGASAGDSGGESGSGAAEARPGPWRHLMRVLGLAVRDRVARRLLLESLAFEGFFHAAKDALQPVLKALAIGLLVGTAFEGALPEGLDDTRRTALLVGTVYVGLFLLSGYASRRAARFAARCGGEDRAGYLSWILLAALGLGMAAAGGLLPTRPAAVVLVLLFVTLHALQNLWRPILISRFDAVGDESTQASVLSLESQFRRLGTAALAPALGYAIDALTAARPMSAEGGVVTAVGVTAGLTGLVLALPALLAGPARTTRDRPEPGEDEGPDPTEAAPAG